VQFASNLVEGNIIVLQAGSKVEELDGWFVGLVVLKRTPT